MALNGSDSTIRSEPSVSPRFYTVAEAAALLRMSTMTLYRAIEAQQFPAIRVRARIIVPARAVEEMAEQALSQGSCVNAAAWVPGAVA
ncbi:helix-turn-helix domain-containing protein [Actinosynnema sp. CS-041913]|uniref:helix-turn-helix domain-containing protein n=1 Tax=Actinosynnema sp. CS-041913 TaxID=3239917 RepID=UPI003D8D08CC